MDLKLAQAIAMSDVAHHPKSVTFSAYRAAAEARPSRAGARRQELGTAFPSVILQPFIDTLLSCPCDAATAGICLVGSKAEAWSAFRHLPRSNRILSDISQAVCEQLSTPLLVLLNGAGAALFEPQLRPQRILPLSAFDRLGPNSSFGLSLVQMTVLLRSEPEPSEALGAFVRRIIREAPPH